jgi:hypothetical protein
MRIRNNLLLTALLYVFATTTLSAQQTAEKTVSFKFLPEQDMFYLYGNDAELNRLYSFVDEYRAEISSGKIPIHVEGHCASLKSRKENLRTAAIRSNRVKSELITRKGLLEKHFITKNHVTAFDGRKDMVIVTLRIPAREEPKEPEAEVKPEPVSEQPPVEERKPEPVVEQQPDPAVAEPSPRGTSHYCLAVRTNLLYDAFLLPTLGAEWRISQRTGIKVDGTRSWWGDRHGKVQKIWFVNPELRHYMTSQKRFYLGASANFGEYNIYKGMAGSFFSGDTGYQGDLWSAGLTAGYQLFLSRNFSLDFNLGLGYTNLHYDSFTISNQTRVYKEKNKSKDFYGPTQAGINLVWTIGGQK